MCFKMDENNYQCQYCKKQCKNKNSLKQHERLCKMNPNKMESSFTRYNKLKKCAWNKGLSKDTDERVRKNAESISQSYASGKSKAWCQGLTKDTDERLRKLSEHVSNTVNNKVERDEWYSSLGKVHHYECNGVYLHGRWELEFGKFLNDKHIKWERPKNKFKYFFQDKWHYYHPDFYLPEHDVYIEIKGCVTEKDIAKWTQFPNDLKIDIYFGDDLKNLNIINDAKTKGNDIILNKIKAFSKKNLDLKNLQ